MKEENRCLSVGQFLDSVNLVLRGDSFLVFGEVFDFQAKSRWVSFSLKDKEEDAILKCVMGIWEYKRVGVSLEDGMEIKVGGQPSISKKWGSFGFWVRTIEPVGEGSFRKAYLLLLKILKEEGLFLRKRPIDTFPHNIGVISSRDGVVIKDFRNNLSKFGLKIYFYDSRVEGPEAVSGVISGLNYFNSKMADKLDLIVIMRGGGSLESMAAFNNELVARAVFASRIPIMSAIGHDVDVPIVSMVADISVSTPTAAAAFVNGLWEPLAKGVAISEERLSRHFGDLLFRFSGFIEQSGGEMLNGMEKALLLSKNSLWSRSSNILSAIRRTLDSFQMLMDKFTGLSLGALHLYFNKVNNFIDGALKSIELANPERSLRLGYTIIFDDKGSVVKRAAGLSKGKMLRAKMVDGEVVSVVEKIILR